MSSSNQASLAEIGTKPPALLAELRVQLRPLLLAVPLLTLLTGVLFPAVLWALARPLFPAQAKGSLVVRDDGTPVGSALIGQDFGEPDMFHSRPSAAGSGYDGTASGGSNLGPANAKLRDGDKDADPPTIGVRQRTEQYRKENLLSADTPVPIDAVTSSGSGLDPHISPANADLQVARVAHQRQLSEDEVRTLVAENTQGRQFGFLGEPRVNVLLLNLALERKAPRSKLKKPSTDEK